MRYYYSCFLILFSTVSGFDGSKQRTKNAKIRKIPHNGRNTTTTTKHDSILCRVTKIDVMFANFETESNDENKRDSVYCIPHIDDHQETDEILHLHLPPKLVKDNRIEIGKGTFFIRITNYTLTAHGLRTHGKYTHYSIVKPSANRRLQLEKLDWKSSMSVSVVRVSTVDASPSTSAHLLRKTFYQDDGPNFLTQYDACSFGQLKFQPAVAPYDIIDVTVSKPVVVFQDKYLALVDEAQLALKETYGIDAINAIADRVIFCLPEGTGSWVASAGLRHWRVHMNDKWCRSLTATMHELGHTMGLLHSNAVKTDDYGDRTGYMGSGTTSNTWPKKCFNGYQLYQFQWYFFRQIDYDPFKEGSRIFELATFVDYDISGINEPVIVNIANSLFLLYNRAKKFNADTEQWADHVTITEPAATGTISHSGLSPTENKIFQTVNFMGSGHTLFIEACEKRVSWSGADVMIVGVSLDSSVCGNAPDWLTEYRERNKQN